MFGLYHAGCLLFHGLALL
jgi:hypothetical protein